jgi:hypothetical protein
VPAEVSLIQSTFEAHLEVMVRMTPVAPGAEGDWIAFYWRDSNGWHGPEAFAPGERPLLARSYF